MFCLWCLCLNAEYAKDLERTLREIGYSVKAVEEILKWYKENSCDR